MYSFDLSTYSWTGLQRCFVNKLGRVQYTREGISDNRGFYSFSEDGVYDFYAQDVRNPSISIRGLLFCDGGSLIRLSVNTTCALFFCEEVDT